MGKEGRRESMGGRKAVKEGKRKKGGKEGKIQTM